MLASLERRVTFIHVCLLLAVYGLNVCIPGATCSVYTLPLVDGPSIVYMHVVWLITISG